MLTSTYLPNTRQLLQNPPAPTGLYSDSLLTGYINTARGQLAGEGVCIRSVATIQTTIGQRIYDFSGLSFAASPSITGIQGALNINTIWYSVGSNSDGDAGLQWVQPKEWERFGLYNLNTPVPTRGPPNIWSQYGQGAAPPGAVTGSSFGGSLYLDPIPDLIYTLHCDCTCYPIPLVLDTDVEAIPYLWTDAVPYFAAYLALLSSQTSARIRDAEEMFKLYGTFVSRARNAANPMQLNLIYQQSQNLFRQAKIGNGQAAPAQQGAI